VPEVVESQADRDAAAAKLKAEEEAARKEKEAQEAKERVGHRVERLKTVVQTFSFTPAKIVQGIGEDAAMSRKEKEELERIAKEQGLTVDEVLEHLGKSAAVETEAGAGEGAEAKETAEANAAVRAPELSVKPPQGQNENEVELQMRQIELLERQQLLKQQQLELQRVELQQQLELQQAQSVAAEKERVGGQAVAQQQRPEQQHQHTQVSPKHSSGSRSQQANSSTQVSPVHQHAPPQQWQDDPLGASQQWQDSPGADPLGASLRVQASPESPNQYAPRPTSLRPLVFICPLTLARAQVLGFVRLVARDGQNGGGGGRRKLRGRQLLGGHLERPPGAPRQ
jgi:hypothetical protein